MEKCFYEILQIKDYYSRDHFHLGFCAIINTKTNLNVLFNDI